MHSQCQTLSEHVLQVKREAKEAEQAGKQQLLEQLAGRQTQADNLQRSLSGVESTLEVSLTVCASWMW